MRLILIMLSLICFNFLSAQKLSLIDTLKSKNAKSFIDYAEEKVNALDDNIENKDYLIYNI